MTSSGLQDFFHRLVDALSHHRRGRTDEPSPPAAGLGQRVARALGRLPIEPPDLAVAQSPQNTSTAAQNQMERDPQDRSTGRGGMTSGQRSERQRLHAGHHPLAYGIPDSKPGTIFALSRTGGVVVGPREGNAVRFGRNRPDVDVSIGEDDRRVARQQGILTHHMNTWWLRNTGRLPLRLPNSQWLHVSEEPQPLTEGYTPLFIPGSNGREHLLELFIAGTDARPLRANENENTTAQPWWRLNPNERLALVVLAQRYLRYEADPRPLSSRQATDQLTEIQPDVGWTPRKVERLTAKVRERLSLAGVPSLVREEVSEGASSEILHNLIKELIVSNTLVPPDLALLDRI